MASPQFSTCEADDFFFTLFHQTFRSGGCSADANASDVLEPFILNRVGRVGEVGARIHLAACFKKNASVGTFESADKDDGVVARGKFLDVGQSVRHLAADGVEIAEASGWLDVGGDVFHDALEPLQRLGRLREQGGVAGQVQTRSLFHSFDDNRFAVGLSHESEHFGVSSFAVNHDLWARHFVIDFFDASLQLQHHGAGGVDEADSSFFCDLIGRWRFAVSTEQNL